MKQLIIAEKPSVAITIAKALNIKGESSNHDGYIEGDNYVVSWCYGHLLENAPPDFYDESFKRWAFETLPIVPTDWKDLPIEAAHAKVQLKVLLTLMKRKDIDSFIEATDAGREGELIFRRVYEYSGSKKPFLRLWISSLEASAIQKGMVELRPSSEYDALYQAALARSRADWLFGINGTRFYTIAGCMGNDKATVGRVQTPTLNMIVERCRAIENFKVEKRYAILANMGTWALESEKVNDEKQAKEMLNDCNGKPVIIDNVTEQKKSQAAPKLFSLTALQREMNRRYGFGADMTLNIIQSLYERKILSYPRTDAEYITADMKDTYLRIMNSLGSKIELTPNVGDVNQVINDAKVTDHYAIIVTELYSKTLEKVDLKQEELKIVDAIIQRMFEAIDKPYYYLSTVVNGTAGSVKLKGNGATPLSEGWKGVGKKMHAKREAEQKEKQNESGNIFPSRISKGQQYKAVSFEIISRDTKPPAYYTEDTLLGDMEKAGAKEMDDEVERKGLGTSATRAEIIKKLISRKYIIKEKKFLKATPEGCHLIDSVEAGFKSVSTTVEWENRLLEIERGRGDKTSDTFCESITEELRKLISLANRDLSMKNEPVGKCPWCGEPMIVTRGVARCECGKRIWTTPYWMEKNKSFSNEDMKKLLSGEGVKAVMMAKEGKKYPITARLDMEATKESEYPEWKFEFESKGFCSDEHVGKCPICEGDVSTVNGVAVCSGCGRKMYAHSVWMPQNISLTIPELKKIFGGGKIKTKLKAKTGKTYNINASIDIEKSISSEKYWEWKFDFLK